MKKVIGLIVSLFLLFSTYAPTFTEAAEVLNKVGWVKEKENWYYYEKDGSKRTETITLDGIEYEFFKDGRLFEGKKQVGNEWLHYKEPGKLQTGWSFSATAWSYIRDGKYATGVITYQGKQFEINKYGEMEKGWVTLRSKIKRMYPKPETKFLFESKPVKDGDVLEVIGKQGIWYQVKYQGEIGYVRIFESVVIGENPTRSWDVVKEGTSLTRFILTEYKKDPEKYFPPNVIKNQEKELHELTENVNNVYYDFQQLKSMLLFDNAKGWVQEEGKWTYYLKNGSRVTGLQTIDNKQYYFGPDGFMQTGWIDKGGSKYYANESGALQKGIQYIDGKMHYFDQSGILSRGMQQVDGKPYYFSYESEPKSGWMKLEYDWYLLHPTGALQTGDFTYKDKVFSFNKDGEMIKGWITLESLVKKVYPEPDLKKVLRAKRVNTGELIEVTGKIGSWYEVKYKGEKGYVRIHDAIIFDQEAKTPLSLLDGKLKIFEGVFNYIKSDEPLLNNTLKTLQDLENNTTDSIELWNNVAKDAEDAKRDLEEQKKQILEFEQKMKVLEKKIKNDWDRLTKEEMRQLIEMFRADAERAGIFGEEQAKHFSEQILRRSHEMVRFMEEVQKSLTQMVEFNNQIYDVIREDIQNVGKFQDQCNIYLKQIADSIHELAESHKRIQQVLHDNGTFEDLGNIATSTIRLKHSIDAAKPGMEELVQVTRKNVPVIAKDLQAFQERVPGIYNDVNTGLDFGNAFMDTASKVVQHKYNIPAAAISVGNIDLSNALRDFGGDYSRIYNRANDGDLSFILDITPGIGTGKEIGQLIKGEDLVTGRKYGPEDYGWGTLSVVSGGTSRIIGKVVGKIGDLEKKGKAIENATKGTSGIGWSMPRGGGVINGRKYTEHALERMAPDTLEIRAELNSRAKEMAAKKGYKLGSAEYNELFSKIDPRGMTPNVVEDIIKTGSRAPADTPGTWKYSRADGYVILNDNGDVITAVPAKKK
ncbi:MULTISPECIES: pre-toxin TG domain-containing protein [unclassified Bacillus (in: firmicutes)]|uniref:pre-toxin TG domain-containing protein n=1 Tax=unclassified Bacillus (in: firmicutes) TaxID=185979 RepID=UPI00077A3AE5|nr:pre-toxin TG domain-containing protein [Bacillus sp. RM2(2019)]KAB2372783.1 S-layer protein [Bacillus sp. RM2(2019)]KXY54582.1 S-layer protein [Bacillus cereus]